MTNSRIFPREDNMKEIIDVKMIEEYLEKKSFHQNRILQALQNQYGNVKQNFTKSKHQRIVAVQSDERDERAASQNVPIDLVDL